MTSASTGAAPPRIRTIEASDAAQVLAIYAEGIATGTATFETAPPTWARWDGAHSAVHRLLAVSDAASVDAESLDAAPDDAADGGADVALGWAAGSPVSERCVYAGVLEVSVYVSAAARGRGVGSALLGALVTRSESAGVWTLQAGVFPENVASLALHARHGFRRVGVRERVGQLDGTWRDVVLLERRSAETGL